MLLETVTPPVGDHSNDELEGVDKPLAYKVFFLSSII